MSQKKSLSGKILFICCNISSFLTSWQPKESCSAQRRALCLRQNVLCLIKVIKAREQISFLTKNELVHVCCTFPVQLLSVTSRQSAWVTTHRWRVLTPGQMGQLFLSVICFQKQTCSSCCLRNECEALQQGMLWTNLFNYTLDSCRSWEMLGCTQQTYCWTWYYSMLPYSNYI